MTATVILVAGVVLATVTAFANLWTAALGRDGSAFALRAHLWLEDGRVPYRDLWDHKTPGIYLFDLVGEVITRDPVTGPRVMESAVIVLTALLATALGRRLGGSWFWGAFALFWYTAAVPNPAIVQWGNFCELILPPAAFFLALELSRAGRPRWEVIGVVVAAAALFRPTAIGLLVGALAVLPLLEPTTARRIRSLARFAVGLGLPFAAVAGWALLGRFQSQLWNQVVTYNRVYAAESSGGLAHRIGEGWLVHLWRAPAAEVLVLLALATLVLHRLHSGRPESRRGTTKTGTLALFSVAALIPVWTAESMSGRFWPHQLLMAAPFLVLLLVVATCSTPARESAALRVAIGLAAVLAMPEVLAWWQPGKLDHGPDPSRTAVIRFLNERSAAGDSLQVWDAEDGLYLHTGLRPATRFSYYYPLLTPGYADSAMIRDFVRALEHSRPRWVVTYVADTTLSPARARASAHQAFFDWLRPRGQPVVRFRNLVLWQIAPSTAAEPAAAPAARVRLGASEQLHARRRPSADRSNETLPSGG